MKNLNLITSWSFWLFINLWGAIIPMIYFLAFVFNSSKIADHGARVWAIVAMWTLKHFCRVDYKVVGLEKVPQQACIIACKHQSMWETIVMQEIFRRPAYVFKKELLKIPFYGWYVKRMSGIAIDRQGGGSALRDMVKKARGYLNNNQNIIIFPQGTRVPVGSDTKKYPYQSGIVGLYSSCKVPVVPAALNSGNLWGRHKTIKKSGTITLKFLDPIPPGLPKEEFLKKLENAIETESDKLAKLKR